MRPPPHVGGGRPRLGFSAVGLAQHGHGPPGRRQRPPDLVQDAAPSACEPRRTAPRRRLQHSRPGPRDDPAPTALERANGNRGPAVRRLISPLVDGNKTVAPLAAAFDQTMAPACRQPRTRAYYCRAWRLVVTRAVARKVVHDILPTSLETLKALTLKALPGDLVSGPCDRLSTAPCPSSSKDV